MRAREFKRDAEVEQGVVGAWHWIVEAVHRSFRVRAIPTPVRDLSALLERPPGGIREGLAELQQLEKALRQNAGFDSLPPDVLRSAAEQLDQLAPGARSKGLSVLRLQMRRQIDADSAYDQAVRHSQPMRWLPVRERSAGEHPVPWPDEADFETTIPLDRGDEEAANDSAFGDGEHSLPGA